ncbi:MAG: hypothetical protein CMQ38_01340 [Gammaproteobacteria bacterium]|nr:hypothetical protein [Gammaproteobacteria bacterium]
MISYRTITRPIHSLLYRLPIMPWLLGVSGHYRVITRDDALLFSRKGWQNPLTASRQKQAYKLLMEDMYLGQTRLDLKLAAQGVKLTRLENPSILEIGCGNGYYVEVFEHLLGFPFTYLGTDYSQAMIDTARKCYPKYSFEVADACKLPYADHSIDIVFNGVSLMHILDFEKAINESKRVAKMFCLYHSVPVFENGETTYLQKYAYGAQVVEVIFNRNHLIKLFKQAGLSVQESWRSIPYDVYPATNVHSHTETFLLKVERTKRKKMESIQV